MALCAFSRLPALGKKIPDLNPFNIFEGSKLLDRFIFLLQRLNQHVGQHTVAENPQQHCGHSDKNFPGFLPARKPQKKKAQKAQKKHCRNRHEKRRNYFLQKKHVVIFRLFHIIFRLLEQNPLFTP